MEKLGEDTQLLKAQIDEKIKLLALRGYSSNGIRVGRPPKVEEVKHV